MTGERTATKRAVKEQPSRALVAKKRGADSSEQAICLVCWDSERAAELASALSGDGFRVTVVSESVKGWVGYFRDLSVDAVVIDLSRLPSHGREVGIMLRGSKSTRHMPLVFLDGTAEKVERVRGDLPDAVFTAWDEAASAIRRAIQTPVENPVRPVQMMERSNRRDLVRRLEVKADVPVVLWGDAEFLVEMLGDVPLVKKKQGNAAHLCLCVTRSALDVEAAFETVASGYPAGTLVWIIHPKQAGRIKVDFNQNDVRALGLARRWVDFKVCAVDADWSGLAFARRKTGEALPRRSMNPMMARR